QKFSVSGSVNQDEIARPRAKSNLACIDGDTLIPLGLQCIEQERPFECHAAPGADRFELFELAVRQTSGFGEQSSDQGRFAVIHMADDDDADQGTENCDLRVQLGGDMGIHGDTLWSKEQGVFFQRYPATRSRSKASSDS